jgi:chemotaxis protein methyltransferase CheR
VSAAWSDPGFATLAALVEQEAGLSWSAGRRDSAEAAMRRAMREARARSVPDYVQLVTGDPLARDELIAELTIGETYFFRDAEQFALIREQLLPDLRSFGRARRLRVWSAGCASGEEAHSLVIVLAEQQLDFAGCVLGTDIARHRLAAARKGSYSRWSLRGVPPSVVARYFTQSGNRYQLAERIRAGAEFRYLNLAEDRYPSLASGVWGMDLVLCRNVLIYFDRDTVARVARRLVASLSEHGWLLLGAADPPIAEYTDCEVVVTSTGIAYRRPSNQAAGSAGRGDVRRLEGAPADSPFTPRAVPPAARTEVQTPEPSDTDLPWADAPTPRAARPPVHGVSPPEPAATPEPPEPREPPETGDDGTASNRAATAYAAREYERVIEIAGTAGPAPDEPLAVLHVRALANLGRLAEASRVCLAALDRHPGSAELTYLHAVLLAQAEHAREAAAAARRALYLDRRLVVAHIALADAAGRLGDGRTARRSLRNAGRLLDALPADMLVPASDGEIAGRLAQLVRTRLRLLEAA